MSWTSFLAVLTKVVFPVFWQTHSMPDLEQIERKDPGPNK